MVIALWLVGCTWISDLAVEDKLGVGGSGDSGRVEGDVDADADADADSDVDLGVDADGDGHDSIASGGDDCDDTRADVYPGAPEEDCTDPVDYNCDGVTAYVDADGDGYAACEECDDNDPNVYPNDAEEIWYNGVDENCDGNDADQDGDGYVITGYEEPTPAIHTGLGTGDCWDDPSTRPSDFVAVNGFDQPEAREVHPGAAEVWYDAVDQDCAGDDDFDQDGDGFSTDVWPDRSGNVGDDCDDVDGTIYSGAPDTWYDGIDSDCMGNSDFDQDGDGHDAEAWGGDDCDDTRASVNPDVNEDCATSYDDDCDGDTNDDYADNCVEFYADFDGDGYGNADYPRCTCEAPADYVSDDTDCDDSDDQVNPGATEVCENGVDDDCDGVTDEECTAVAIIHPADGTSVGDTFEIELALTSFTLDSGAVGGTPVTGEGHVHVYIDGSYFTYTAEEVFTVSGVPDGSHGLEVVLVENDHTEVTPRVSDSITIVVTP